MASQPTPPGQQPQSITSKPSASEQQKAQAANATPAAAQAQAKGNF
jgi:hypothetical protein